jgi:adenylosuccinate synthase
MAHKIDMVLDFQYGSTGKGLIAGWLAKRGDYDTAICAFATNAGHTYIDVARGIHAMTQQLPTAITSPTVKNILIGPGSAIHGPTLKKELVKYTKHLHGKTILIHPNAAVVEDYHAGYEMNDGRTRMGSTAKGVGEAYIERIRRSPDTSNIVAKRWKGDILGSFVVTDEEYRRTLDAAENVIIEGAQGFSLSMYHGFYPYTTSRDVTPWQVAADCGIPFKWANYIKIIGTLRTFPIRVNNRDGSSGPHYPDQQELDWAALTLDPELTTVTKLPRRLFTFSHEQLRQALWHCGAYWETKLFLNFANYVKYPHLLESMIKSIETPREGYLNAPRVEWLGFGPDDCDVQTRTSWEAT